MERLNAAKKEVERIEAEILAIQEEIEAGRSHLARLDAIDEMGMEEALEERNLLRKIARLNEAVAGLSEQLAKAQEEEAAAQRALDVARVEEIQEKLQAEEAELFELGKRVEADFCARMAAHNALTAEAEKLLRKITGQLSVRAPESRFTGDPGSEPLLHLAHGTKLCNLEAREIARKGAA